jgi:hypothetical protein
MPFANLGADQSVAMPGFGWEIWALDDFPAL